MQRPPLRSGSGSRISRLASDLRRVALNGGGGGATSAVRSRPSSRSRSRDPSVRNGTASSAVPSRSTTPVSSQVDAGEKSDDEALLGERIGQEKESEREKKREEKR